MAEYAEALIRRTKKLTVSGICALAVGAGMLGGGTGIASADQISANGTVTTGSGDSKTQGIVRAGSQGDTRASEVSNNCSDQLSSGHTCPNVVVAKAPAGTGTAKESSMAVPTTFGDSPAPGNKSACLYFLAGLQTGSTWNWVGDPGC